MITLEQFKEFVDKNLYTKIHTLNTAKIKNDFEWIKKYYPEYYNYIKEKSKKFEQYNLSEGLIIALLYHNLPDAPRCKICGKPLKFYVSNVKDQYENGYCQICATRYKRKINFDKFRKTRKQQTSEKWQYLLENLGKEYKNSNLNEFIKLCDKNIAQLFSSVDKIYSKYFDYINDVIYLTKNIIKFNPEKYKKINDLRISERIYLIKNNLKKIPKCECGKDRKFINYYQGYAPTCGNRQCVVNYQAKQRIKITENKIKEKIKNLYPDFELIEEYQNHNISVKIKCKKCGTEFDKVFRNGSYFSLRCPKCQPLNNQSTYEYKIRKLLDDYKIPHENNKRFFFNENKRNFYELDIYIPDKKLGIEIDEVYWHSFKTNNDKYYHQKKDLFFKERDIKVIHFLDLEIDFKYDIVKSIILSNLGIFKEKIYARNCKIKEITTIEYKNFCEENHLQGYASSKYKLGLFYEDELVSIMSFGKRKISSKVQFELLRFANKKFYQIIGGASKLLKYFLKNYDVNTTNIISYCNFRIFDGKFYEKLGFNFKKLTQPNYYYIKNDKILNRISFQKHKLINKLKDYNKNFTEKENMIKNNYLIYYDSGQLIYEKII